MRRFLVITLMCSVSAYAFLGFAYAASSVAPRDSDPFAFGFKDVQTNDEPDDDRDAGGKNTGKKDKTRARTHKIDSCLLCPVCDRNRAAMQHVVMGQISGITRSALK